MKAVQAEKIGSIDDFRVIDIESPQAGPDDVLIEVRSCGMGYVDALVATGGYQVKPPVPFTPGQEFSGIVVETGRNARGFEAGDRVVASAFGGGLAEYAAVAASGVRKIPDRMSFPQAAIFRVNYLTAIHGLVDRAALQPGERLLVLGAAGGVGAAAVQIGTRLGGRVIACASNDEKRRFASALGARDTLGTDIDGWRDHLKEICDGKGPAVIFDPVCGPLFELAFRSLAWGGRHLVVGFAGGPIPALKANLPLMKGSGLIGVDMRQFHLFERGRSEAHMDRLLAWVSDGTLNPPVGQSFSFNAFAEAMAFAMSGTALGKCVIEVSAG